MPEVVIYTTMWCPFCARAKALLKNKGVRFTEIDVEAQLGKYDEMKQKAGRTSVPQIFIGEHHVGGYDDLVALDRGGGLRPLLEGGQ